MASSAVGPGFWATTEACVHCGSDEFAAGFCSKTFIQCDCCSDHGVHVGCHEQATGEALTQERVDSPSWRYFCCKDCERISKALVDQQGKREPAAAGASEYTVELARYTTSMRSSAVEAALQIFQSAIAPMRMENGRDLIQMVCQAYETPDGEAEEGEEAYNFSGFRVYVLRKRGVVVTAATVRVFGAKFAEVPFVATREGYRNNGNCRLLMKALDGLLHKLGVQWVIIPSMKGVLPMWTKKFGYQALSKAECEVLEERVVMPDPDSAVLVRKRVLPPSALKKQQPKPVAGKAGKSLRYAIPLSYKEASDSDDDKGKASESDSDGYEAQYAAEAAEAEGSSEEEGEEGGGLEVEEDLVPASRSRAAAAARPTSSSSGQALQGLPAGGGAEKAVDQEGEEPAKTCYNCGIGNPASWSKGPEGQPECNTCHRYRRENDGKAQPASVYQRSKAWRDWKEGRRGAPAPSAPKPPKPSQRSAGPALAPVAAAAAAAATLHPATPADPPHQPRWKRRLRHSMVGELKKAKEEEGHGATKGRQQQLRIDHKISLSLAGLVMDLVQEADTSHASIVQDMQQRLDSLHLEKQAVADSHAGLQAEHSAACAAHALVQEQLQRKEGTAATELKVAWAQRDAAEQETAQCRAELAARDAELAQFRALFQQLTAGTDAGGSGAPLAAAATASQPSNRVAVASPEGVGPAPILAAAVAAAPGAAAGAAVAAAPQSLLPQEQAQPEAGTVAGVSLSSARVLKGTEGSGQGGKGTGSSSEQGQPTEQGAEGEPGPAGERGQEEEGAGGAGGGSSRRTSGEALAAELFGMFAGPSQPGSGGQGTDGVAVGDSSALAEGALGALRTAHMPPSEQLQRQQRAEEGGSCVEDDSLDEVMAGSEGEEDGDLQGRSRRLALVLEQAMCSQESRRPGLSAPPPSPATTAPPTAPGSMQGLCSGRALLSPAEQLQALVEAESQGRGGAEGLPDDDAALALAMGVAADIASDLDG